MPSDRATWYVKASIGTEWGPISTETLLQMANDGSLVGNDFARSGEDGPWQPVAGVLELLRANVAPTRGTEAESPRVAELSGSQPIRRGALPGWTTYWTPDSTGEPPDPAKQPVSSTLEQSIEGPGTSAQFDELNAWKRERQERLDRLKKIVAERETVAAPTEPRSDTEDRNSALEERPDANVSTMSSASELRATPSTVSLRDEEWEETLARWRQSIPDWRFVVPLILLPWLAWSFWPTTHSHIAETYRSMYAELCRLRDQPLNKTGLEEFVTRSQAQLDEFLPKLERQAAAQDSDGQLLLSMGRDCLKPLLASPRQRGTSQEERLKGLLAEWDRTHGIVWASPRESNNSKE